MFTVGMDLMRRWTDMVVNTTEAMVEKIESVVTHPEVSHFVDLIDAIADKNMEVVDLIGVYGSNLAERISTRNETKE